MFRWSLATSRRRGSAPDVRSYGEPLRGLAGIRGFRSRLVSRRYYRCPVASETLRFAGEQRRGLPRSKCLPEMSYCDFAVFPVMPEEELQKPPAGFAKPESRFLLQAIQPGLRAKPPGPL